MLLIGIILRHAHAINGGIVASQILGIDAIIVRVLQEFHFVLGKTGMSDSLDALIQFAMNAGTGHADKATNV